MSTNYNAKHNTKPNQFNNSTQRFQVIIEEPGDTLKESEFLDSLKFRIQLLKN